MGLWMFLLLHFHLGNAPWTEVVCFSLPAPSNVSISSFNMEHTLSFLPGPKTPADTHFTVQIHGFSRKSWRSVAGCLELIAGQTCNLTAAFKNPIDHYQARIRAVTSNQSSDWTTSRPFQAHSDTVIGPPDVSVSGCGNCLLLRVSVPRTKGLQQYQQLQSLYRELHLQVQRTRDGVQFRLNLPYKEENMITYLQPGVEYCVTVTVTVFYNSNSVPSKPFCAFTSPPPPRTTMHVVYGLLGAFCMLGFLLIGSVVYGSHLSYDLLTRHLPRTLSYIVLQGQDHGGAPGQTSAPQIHNRGSADGHRSHEQPLRSSSGQVEEEEERGQTAGSAEEEQDRQELPQDCA